MHYRTVRSRSRLFYVYTTAGRSSSKVYVGSWLRLLRQRVVIAWIAKGWVAVQEHKALSGGAECEAQRNMLS